MNKPDDSAALPPAASRDIKTIVKLPAHIAAEPTHADDIALVSALVTTSAAAQLVATAATEMAFRATPLVA